MSADVSVELNANLMNELHSHPAVTVSSRAAAVAIAARAREIAPVETGRYRDGIIVDPPNNKSGVARVHATDPKSSWVEYGNGKQPPQFIIRIAAESLGYRFIKKKG